MKANAPEQVMQSASLERFREKVPTPPRALFHPGAFFPAIVLSAAAFFAAKKIPSTLVCIEGSVV